MDKQGQVHYKWALHKSSSVTMSFEHHSSLQAEGIVKYNHNDSVQVLAYNPSGQELASGTATDFGLWSPELKHVAKHKVCSPKPGNCNLLGKLQHLHIECCQLAAICWCPRLKQ